MLSTFRALRGRNYRRWAAGAFLSNIGTWMQRTAQDWLVLVELTHHQATQVGLVMALQFGPQLLLLPVTGYAADRYDRRHLIFVTQAGMGLLALGLGLLTLAGMVKLWQVDAFALALGCLSAFDAPARQTFISDLVADTELANAVALNSASFHSARLIGPALAGLMIASIGSGGVFLINALSFVAVLIALTHLKLHPERPTATHQPPQGGLAAGFLYLGRRKDLLVLMVMIFIVGTFGLNFPIFISTMCVSVFHADARTYGYLSSVMALGSLSGALYSASRMQPSQRLLLWAVSLFALGCCAAAFMPDSFFFGVLLVLVGASAQIYNTSSNSMIQLSCDPAMRGRVLAIMLALFLGGTPLGAPVIGYIADHLGPRWAMLSGGMAALLASGIGILYLARFSRQPESATAQ